MNLKKRIHAISLSINSNSKTKGYLFFAVLIFTFVYMVFLNIKTPLIADDYVYTFIFGTPIPVGSIEDIVKSQITYYMSWGGRVVAESLTQLFVFWGKSVFNVANSLCYTVFILAIYFNAVGRKIRPVMLLTVTIMVWFFTPMFGQTVMWITGSCNYLWCGTIILLAILPFRLYEEKQTRALKSIWFGIVMIPLFFLSGITNENTAGGMILIMLLLCFVYYKRKIKIPVFAYTGLAFSVLGFLCMIFAPGNGLRADNESAVAEVTALVGSNPMITRFSYFAYNLYALMPLIIIAVIAFLFLYRAKGKKGAVIFGIFTIAAAASMLVMLAPPKFPPRAMFGLVSFMIIAVIYALDQLEFSRKITTARVFIPACFMLLYYGMSLGYAGVDAVIVMRHYEARVAIIEEQRGADYIAVPAIVPLTSYNGLYGLRDVQADPNHWVNRALADYYGVSNIILQQGK
ncbi:DUF3329 domain-containing protein [Acetobacterium bakii]|uniref:Glycosyltransferase RgtA/B/C/D-like domain-containing protein n=1 Tax=Acetobacterium bakii TaxID=52689 RepID=A0A0L6U3I0_9FIRM|nr:DUF6056 family protein [Acetobacterium bakii]KNZ43076.1 hypothetical protein AKG39_02665 [Acetobacterium bakii]